MERPDLVARAFLGLLEEGPGVQGGPWESVDRRPPLP
jgi:hypothetical protein